MTLVIVVAAGTEIRIRMAKKMVGGIDNIGGERMITTRARVTTRDLVKGIGDALGIRAGMRRVRRTRVVWLCDEPGRRKGWLAIC